MVESMSISDFTKMVSESAEEETTMAQEQASEEMTHNAMETTQPSKILFDDLDDLDDEDEDILPSASDTQTTSDNFDALDDLDDLEDDGATNVPSPIAAFGGSAITDATTSMHESTNLPNTMISSTTEDTMSFFKTKHFEDDIIWDYNINTHIEVSHEDKEEPSTMFELIVAEMDHVFLVTKDCANFCDLWNTNFIASKTSDEVMAFMRLTAMFYHLDFASMRIANEVMQDGSAETLLRLVSLGKVIRAHDIHEVDTSDDVNDIAAERLQAVDNLDVNTVVESNASTTAHQMATESIAPTISMTGPAPIRKIPAKRKKKLFIEKITEYLFTDETNQRMANVPRIMQCFDSLQDLYYSSKITDVEFIKFTVFLAKTREVVLDTKMVEQARTFNNYWAMMLLGLKKSAFNYSEVDTVDSVFILSEQLRMTEMFTDYVALNWRMFQLQVRTNTAITIETINNQSCIVISMPGIVEHPAIHFLPKKSDLTKLAEDFTAAFNQAYVNTNDIEKDFVWERLENYDKFYSLIKDGIEIPTSYLNLSRHQYGLLAPVLAQIRMEHQELLPMLTKELIKQPWRMRPSTWFNQSTAIGSCNASTTAKYQIIAFALNAEGNCEIHIRRVMVDCDPQFVLLGDGVVPGTRLNLHEFISLYDQIAEHVRLSSKTDINVCDNELQINFTK